jgi:hypothetical protein
MTKRRSDEVLDPAGGAGGVELAGNHSTGAS